MAIGAGWGTTATKAITTGANDVAGQIVVTSAGTGQSQATATVTVTGVDPARVDASYHSGRRPGTGMGRNDTW